MSVIFNVDGEGAKRTSNIVAASSDYTCLFYAKNNAPTAAGGKTLFITYNGAGTYTNWAAIFAYDDDTIKVDCDNGSGTVGATTGFTWAEDVWYRVAYVRQGTANRFYVQAPGGALTLIGSFTCNFAASTFNETWIGDDGSGIGHADLEIAYFREWDNDLNITQLLTEFQNLDTSEDNGNINGDWPLTADLDDISGLNHDWTAVGSLTFDAAEPAFPANNQRSAAIEITPLPFSDTQDVLINGFAYPVWYKYVTAADDIVLSLWGYGDGLGTYSVATKAYKDAETTQFLDTTLGQDKPVRFSLLQGSTYYIEFSPFGNVALSAADLLIEAETFVPQVVPVGSIIVNDDDDATYFPATFLSAVDGDDYNTLLYINQIAIGEAGDVLDNGISLLSEGNEGICKLYEPDFTEITDVAIDVGTTRAIRTCQGQQTFFVGDSDTNSVVSEVDDTGAILDTWTLTGISTINALCANNDKTILYFSRTSSDPVRRWDLVNDVALSDFKPTEAGGYRVIDILILSDDSILVSWQIIGGGSTSDFFVRRYNAAGTLLNTYSFGTQDITGSGACRMAYAVDQPNSFWVFLHPSALDTGISVFRNVKVSDGTTLAEVQAIEYFRGRYTGAETLTPVSLTGPSRSCPFFITRVAIELTGTGTLIVRKVTVPSGSVQEFDVEVGGGLSPDTLVMQDGDEETYVDVPAGDGYSVTEVNLPEGWNVVGYEVSNGSPHDNISIAADEEVIVTIVNSTGGGGIFRVPTIPTNPQTPPQRFDDFPADGEITPVKIPNPFFTTALIQDK